MLKAVVFDMDGVLVDTEKQSDIHHIKLLKENFDIDVTADYFQKFRGTTGTFFWTEVIKEFNLKTTVKEALTISRPHFLDHLKSIKLDPIPGVTELIKELLKNNIKIAIASSSSYNRIKTILEIIKLTDKFEIIISADHIKNSKPHPEIYLIAAKTLGVDPKNCIAIEDATNGVKSAKAAGMKVIGYKDPKHNFQDLSEADLIIKDFRELNIPEFNI